VIDFVLSVIGYGRVPVRSRRRGFLRSARRIRM